MAVNPKHLVDTLKSQCEEIPERVPGYRGALLDAVADVFYQEREHAIRATTIQQRVTDLCEGLAKYLASDEDTHSS